MQTLTEGWSERALLRWPTASASAGAKSNTCCVPCVEDTAQSPLYVLRVVVRVVAEPRAKRVGTAQVEKYRRCLQQRNAHQQQALQPARSIRRFGSCASSLLKLHNAITVWPAGFYVYDTRQVGQCSVTSPNDALLLPPCCAYNSFRNLQALVLPCASDHYLDY